MNKNENNTYININKIAEVKGLKSNRSLRLKINKKPYGHVLNFQVINPFTSKPTRATLVGFSDWKSTALK